MTDGRTTRKAQLVSSIDEHLHNLEAHSDPAVRQMAAAAHSDLHDLAALTSDDPEIRASVGHRRTDQPVEREIEREHRIMRDALVRLRNCDWVITPMDRMDAVRDIARAALEGREDRPHD